MNWVFLVIYCQQLALYSFIQSPSQCPLFFPPQTGFASASDKGYEENETHSVMQPLQSQFLCRAKLHRQWKLPRLTNSYAMLKIVFYSNAQNNTVNKKIRPTSKRPSHDIKTTLKYLNRASESVSPGGLAGPCPQTFPGGPVCLCMCVNAAWAVAPL